MDAWSEVTATDVRPPQEAAVVCVDRSSSMDFPMRNEWCTTGNMEAPDSLSRLSEVKELFRSFAARLLTQQMAVHLGLLTFSTRHQLCVEQKLSPVLLNFQERLDEAQSNRGTAIWDALEEARTMLGNYGPSNNDEEVAYPRRRIIVLTDREDDSSSLTSEIVCKGLLDDGIVLDAIVIGTNATRKLFKIAKHTGGYAFAPCNRDRFFQIPLLETFTDVVARPDIDKVPLGNWSKSMPRTSDMATVYDIPSRRPHPGEYDDLIPLNRAGSRFGGTKSSSTSVSSVPAKDFVKLALSSTGTVRETNPSVTTTASGAPRHIHREVVEMTNNLHDYLSVYVSQSNMGFWKAFMQGPQGSPYSKGIFLLYIEMGERFPIWPPTGRFLTPVLHPNVSKQGRICHPVFDREWNSSIRIYQVLEQIYGMLMSIEVNSREPQTALHGH